MLLFVGYMLLFFLHSAVPQPFKLQKLSDLESLIREDTPADPALNLYERSYKSEAGKIGVVPSGYDNINECNDSDIRSSAYKFHNTRKTWNQARMTCFSEGGYLAYPECWEEEQSFRTKLRNTNNKGAWIGLHDFYEEGDWVTLFDKDVSLLEYANWAENQPDNDGDDENCGQLGKDGFWYDKQCGEKYAFFCKLDI